jgi:class 3 adenylate cyclase
MNADHGPRITSKNLDEPDEVRDLGHGTGAFVDVRGVPVGRAVLEPGWRWSIDVKPLVGTPSCQVHHFQLVLAGRFGVRMDSGEEHEFGPSEVIDIPPGHDTWVVGDEPVVLVDMAGNVADFALPASRARTVLTMLMTDIVDSTQTASQIGDAAWKQRLSDHNRIVRRQLERFGGREIDTTGDGFLAVFGSAEGALRAALAICHAVTAAGVEIRAGVHTGEVDTLEGGDLRGIAVHETARIMAAAPAGSVYTSGVSRALASASGIRFESTGTHSLKGFDAPVELFRVEQTALGS